MWIGGGYHSCCGLLLFDLENIVPKPLFVFPSLLGDLEAPATIGLAVDTDVDVGVLLQSEAAGPILRNMVEPCSLAAMAHACIGAVRCGSRKVEDMYFALGTSTERFHDPTRSQEYIQSLRVPCKAKWLLLLDSHRIVMMFKGRLITGQDGFIRSEIIREKYCRYSNSCCCCCWRKCLRRGSIKIRRHGNRRCWMLPQEITKPWKARQH